MASSADLLNVTAEALRDLRSRASQQSSYLEFVNQYGIEAGGGPPNAIIYSIGFDGKWVQYAQLVPGESHKVILSPSFLLLLLHLSHFLSSIAFKYFVYHMSTLWFKK